MAKKACSYEALARNNFHLPDRKSALCVSVFLQEMYEGTCFSWKTSEIVVLNCFRPPPIKYLT